MLRWALTVFSLSGATPAFSAPNYILATLGNLSQPEDNTPSVAISPTTKIGAALLTQFQLGRYRSWSLETGLVYAPRSWSRTVSATETQLSLTTLQVPLGLRWSYSKYSLSGGGYFAQTLGKISQTVNSVQTELSPSEANFNTSDYGLYGSAAVSFPERKKYSAWLEARYNYGVSDLSTGNHTFYSSELQLLLGIRFGRRSSDD